MLLLASTSDKIRLTTSSAANVDVHASWVDLASGVTTPGRTNTAFSSATTADIVAAPAASTYRTIKTLCIRNRHASLACDVTVIHTDGTNAMELVLATLVAGDALHYDEHHGFTVRDTQGRIKVRNDTFVSVSVFTTVVLASDVVNNNAVANTIQDITGLSFPVVGGQTYEFRFVIGYDAAATSTGSRWAINGPASPTWLGYNQRYPLTATTTTDGYQSTYDAPAAASGTSLSTGNIAIIEGTITPANDGTVIGRFASEIAGSAITAKAGSILQWRRTL